MGKYIFVTLAILAVLALLITASAGGNDLDNLKKLVSSLNDPKMTVQDLAFFLATHNYDARPTKDYVELKLDDKVYKLIPNGGNLSVLN